MKLSTELLESIALFCSSKELAHLCLVNRYFYSVVIRLLYKNVMILNPRQYMSFKSTRPTLKSLVRRLDFSGYTTRGTRMPESKSKLVVTTDSLGWLLRECDRVQDLLVGEELMDVFLPLTVHARLRTLDLTGFTGAVRDTGGLIETVDDLENISFYHSTALSQDQFLIPLFQRLSAKGVQLKKLDLGQTKITSALFSHLPSPQHLSHLSLRACHSLVCCSDLMCYLERCHQLKDLKLSGQFCSSCLSRLFRSLPASLDTLDLTGLDAVIKEETLALLPNQLKYLSFANCHLNPSSLFPRLPSTLIYLNLQSLVPLDLSLLQNATPKVIEISSSHTKGYPDQWGDWKLKHHGRRLFYAKMDPSELYSKKIILSTTHSLSPMNRYWCFAL
ncbi:hypothetical protein G6F30_008076 [Rhizopus arrhizus]|nr:hypothetical protein G6F30_008076 [Rhizopus arrhizus]